MSALRPATYMEHDMTAPALNSERARRYVPAAQHALEFGHRLTVEYPRREWLRRKRLAFVQKHGGAE